MKTIQTQWLSDFYSFPIPARLERAEFVSKYLPQYAREYRPPTGIRAYTDKAGKYHVPQTTRGSLQSQLTKRENRIEAAYAMYCAHWQAAWEMDAKNASPATAQVHFPIDGKR